MGRTRLATPCYILRDGEVLLIRKKRGFGANKYNGVGGKVEEGEGVLEAAIREIREEVGIEPLELRYAGVLEFYSEDDAPDWVVYVYTCTEARGTPRPSEEAEPYWFPIDNLPFDKMWEDDRFWLPQVLKGRRVRGRFRFSRDYSKLLEWELTFT